MLDDEPPLSDEPSCVDEPDVPPITHANGSESVTVSGAPLHNMHVLVWSDEQQHAVVLLLLAYSPLGEQSICVRFDGHAFQRFQRHDGDLGGCLAFEGLQKPFEIGFVRFGQDRGKVIDIARGWGKSGQQGS